MRSRDAKRTKSDYKSIPERGLVGSMIRSKPNLGLGLKAEKKSKWTGQLAEELHKSVTRKFRRRKVTLTASECGVLNFDDTAGNTEWRSTGTTVKNIILTATAFSRLMN